MNFSLDGKIALVTGVSRGLGRAMAIALAQAGADIIGVGYHGMGTTRTDIEALGRRAHEITWDLTDSDKAPLLAKQCTEAFGRVDILVNNAGIIRLGPAEDCPAEDFDAVMDVNLRSLFLLTRDLAKGMIAQGGGKIINVCSVQSCRGGFLDSAYVASKHAVHGLTRAWANEWGRYGINVNAIAPGYMVTDNTANLRKDTAAVAAALETKTGKVAVVNGVAYPSNVNYQYGFESGVHYAVKNLGATAEIVELPSYAGTDVTNTNVGGNYTGDFGNKEAGKTIGQALIQAGCDIIFVAAGDSGNGVFTAAMEASSDVKVIGCDVDQYDDGKNGSSNIILTSVLKNMAINVERQLNAIADGSFKGGNNTLHADTDSTGYVSAEGRQQLSADTLKALADVYPLVKDGTIVPAANFNGILPESFQ